MSAAWHLADEFRRIFESDSTFAGINCATEQDTDNYRTPALVIHAVTTPIDARGKVVSYQVTIRVESNANDGTDAAHAALVSTGRRKLFGSPTISQDTAKTAITAAFLAGGKFTLRNYDATDPADPSSAASRFVTPINIRGIALVAADI